MRPNIPNCVRAVLDKPGKYQFKGRGYAWFFEVDANGIVYQLDWRTMQRDGILSPTGWNDDARYGGVVSLKLEERQ